MTWSAPNSSVIYLDYTQSSINYHDTLYVAWTANASTIAFDTVKTKSLNGFSGGCQPYWQAQ